MNQYLIDNTREHLIAAAAYAIGREEGDLRIQILACPTRVHVRACAGGIHKTWISDFCPWDDLATSKQNLLVGLIDGVLFRLARQCAAVAGPAESGQKVGNADGKQDSART